MDIKKKAEEFVKANPKIEEALHVFQITEEQYKKALQSLQSGTFASDTTNITLDSGSQWTNQ